MIPRARPRARGRVRNTVLVALLFAAGCGDINLKKPGVGRASFKADYFSARSALEKGQFVQAADQYGGLVAQAGPMAGRVQIEYAHALLRAGQFADAARVASEAAQVLTGLARASALAVQGTAEHELALSMMAGGGVDETVHARLVSARKTFDAIGGDFPKLDPEGYLAKRRALIVQSEARVKATLGG